MNHIRAWTWSLRGAMVTPELTAMLSADERDRAARFRRDQDRDAYVIAHVGLRTLLADELAGDPQALVFATTATGKPYLPQAQALHFNLSHSAAYALCAIGAVPLGVDIEQRASITDLSGVLAQIASAAERQELSQLPDAEREGAFFRLWVRKEAWLKAIGCGLSGRPDAYEIGNAVWPDCWQALGQGSDDLQQWCGRALSAPTSHFAAIVVAADAQRAPELQQSSLPDHWLDRALQQRTNFSIPIT